MKVQVWDYLKEYREEKAELLDAVQAVCESGTLVFGEHTKQFEKEFARYCQNRYGIGVGNGTDALRIALMALGIGEGDEVITVSNTAIPTISAIVQVGAKPVFVDIDPIDYLMNVQGIEHAITKKTKCILPVHLFGQCVQMDPLKELADKYSLSVLEDCAQAHGALYGDKKAGSMGNAATWSFYPTKVLGTYGDGGMITTNSEDLYELMASLRFYGIEGYGKPSVDRKYYSMRHGINSRLDEIHAAILLKKLSHIEQYIEKRRAIAKIYDQELSDTNLILPTEREHNKHVYYVYVVRHPNRKHILEELKKKEIFLNISYPYEVHLMEGYRNLSYKKGDLPITEQMAQQIFSLPMYPGLSESAIEYTIDALKTLV
jgi:aminotransferase EvaB